MKVGGWLVPVLLSVATLSAQQRRPEVISGLGQQLYARVDSAGLIAQAESLVTAYPDSVALLVQLGLAYASVWHYSGAIETFSQAIELDPENAFLYYHRGRRYVSTRQFDRAAHDFERAAALNRELFEVWYYLGLACHLRGDFERAATAFNAALRLAEDDDHRVAASDWMWMALSRAGRHQEAIAVLAPISEGMDVKENIAHYKRLLFYKGIMEESEISPGSDADEREIVTLGYGIANWYLVEGDVDKAVELFSQVVESRYWPALPFIAAEAELIRKPQLKKPGTRP